MYLRPPILNESLGDSLDIAGWLTPGSVDDTAEEDQTMNIDHKNPGSRMTRRVLDSHPKSANRYSSVYSVIITFVTLLILGAIGWIDWISGPNLNLSIAYFLPITFAAWFIGRPFALVATVLATVPYAADQVVMAYTTHQATIITIIDTIVPLLVFLFATEATTRLHQRSTQVAGMVRQLQARNADLQQAYSLLDDDFQAAGIIQTTLLEIPRLHVRGIDIGAKTSYARAVGGDFAAVEVSDGFVYACIADISGKGTPAALFTALLKYLLDEALRQKLRGAGVVEYINASLLQVLPPERFVTLFLVEIDQDNGSFQYVNAGHPEGLLFRRETNSLEGLMPTNQIIGLSDTLCVRVAENKLHDGDVLLLYTDGATDSQALDGARLGEEPIRSFVKQHIELDAQAMAEAVVASIEAQTLSQLRDDLSVICIRKTSYPHNVSC